MKIQYKVLGYQKIYKKSTNFNLTVRKQSKSKSGYKYLQKHFVHPCVGYRLIYGLHVNSIQHRNTIYTQYKAFTQCPIPEKQHFVKFMSRRSSDLNELMQSAPLEEG